MRRVVITGLGLLTSIGSSVKETWDNLISCKSGIKKIKTFDTNDLSCKIAGFISEDPNDEIFFEVKIMNRVKSFYKFYGEAKKQSEKVCEAVFSAMIEEKT